MVFAEGFPIGYQPLTTLTFTPTFISVSPNSGGSIGGTLMTITGTGFGVDTTGLGLKDVTTNQPLCSKVQVTGYGTFTCLTVQVNVASSDVLKMSKDSTLYACSNSNTANC